jgi:hypothetical protein
MAVTRKENAEQAAVALEQVASDIESSLNSLSSNQAGILVGDGFAGPHNPAYWQKHQQIEESVRSACARARTLAGGVNAGSRSINASSEDFQQQLSRISVPSGIASALGPS